MDKNKIGSIVGATDTGIRGAPNGPDPNVNVNNNDSGKPETIAGYEAVDPRDATGDATGGNDAPKRRGRPKGSKNVGTGTQAPKTKTTLEGLENILLSIHLMGAGFLKCPELVIEQKEAEKISEAIKRVAEFYPIGFTEKQMAWANLIFVLATIEGTRIIAIWNRTQKENRQKPRLVSPIEEFPSRPKPDQKVNGSAAPTRTPSGEPKITNPSQIFGNIVSDSGEDI
jgi:hypothetical protein